MHRKITTQQIEDACYTLLRSQRTVRIQDVRATLLARHGATGRTEHIGPILRLVEKTLPIAMPQPVADTEFAILRDKLQLSEERAEKAERRARRAEQIADDHQDFWARRYADKVQEIEQRVAATVAPKSRITPEQYLRIHQRAAELARRLAQYETVDPLPDVPRAALNHGN